MRRGAFTLCLAFVFLLGGVAILFAEPRLLLNLFRPHSNALIATLFFCLAAGSVVLGLVCIRRGCRDLSAQLRQRTLDHSLSDLHCPHPDLAECTGLINRLLSMAREETSRAQTRVKELEISLKIADAERQHAEAIIYSISDAVLVTDVFDDLVLANESAARTFQFDLDSAGRKPLTQVLRDEKMIQLIREMRQSDSRNGRRIVEHRLQTPEGLRTYKVTFSCISGQNAQPAGVVAVLHDVTREKELSQVKNDFVSHVSHELRTPLASIKAYSEMLIDGEAEDEKTRMEFCEVVQNEANRLSRLIDNILNIARMESGLVKVNKQPQSLLVIIKEALEVIAPQARSKHIRLQENLVPACYQTLGDRDMLYQAVLNLLSNAVKYTPENGTISVQTEVQEAHKRIRCRISDTGIGIPPKDVPFVFDKFYRTDKGTHMAKGTGLGLSLVKQIVESVHGGQVFVESQLGAGSTFGFELELCD